MGFPKTSYSPKRSESRKNWTTDLCPDDNCGPFRRIISHIFSDFFGLSVTRGELGLGRHHVAPTRGDKTHVFYHHSRLCNRAPKCLKCSGSHLTADCKNPLNPQLNVQTAADVIQPIFQDAQQPH
ncbi:hypothetical protein TNCV_269701 [Trichonephila clavipes]|nr:hypothetical protein TNCV_269701 [Trichonephila clavipes]